MPRIINNQTAQVNLVLIPERVIDIYNLKIDKIKTKLEDIYPESKPIITQFPELILIFEPNNQIAVNVIRDDNRIIIADNKITPYTARELSNFLKFAKETSDIITDNNTIKGYGFNIVSIFDIEGEDINSGEILMNKFLKSDSVREIFPGLDSAGFKIVYKDEGTRYEIKLEPRYGTNLEATNSINLNFNAHYSGILPSLTDLKTNCQKTYDDLASNITTIFN